MTYRADRSVPVVDPSWGQATALPPHAGPQDGVGILESVLCKSLGAMASAAASAAADAVA